MCPLKVSWGEGDDRGWDSWMASLTQQAWVWARSRSCWWTGKPGLLQSMGSQREGHDWVPELICVYIYMYINCTWSSRSSAFLPLLCPQWNMSSMSVNHQVSFSWTSLYSTSVFSVRIYRCASRLVFSFLWSYLHPLLVYLMQPCDFKCVVAGLNFS